MKFRTATLPLLVMAASPTSAHDFWIQPQHFQVQAQGALPVTFQVGHGAARDRWTGQIAAVNQFSPGGRRDLRDGLVTSPDSSDLVTRLSSNGIHVIALKSRYAFSNLPALRFNDYAKAEGLTPILAARQLSGSSDKPGRERYSRRAKALVQVGSANHGDQIWATKPIGLSLEIVPERNPYALSKEQRLPVRVYYKGRALAGATVKLTNLAFDAKPVAVSRTDRSGRTSFLVPQVGDWLINVIWSEPVQGDPAVDFDTTFSSLTFGYDSPRRTGGSTVKGR